jgi:hypothetical protein
VEQAQTALAEQVAVVLAVFPVVVLRAQLILGQVAVVAELVQLVAQAVRVL